MAKVVHHVQESSDSGSNLLLAVILIIFFGFIFFYWGLPLVKSVQQEGINIQVPENIQINVNQQPSAPTN